MSDRRTKVNELLTDEELRERHYNSPGVKQDIAKAVRRAQELRGKGGKGKKDLLNDPREQP